VEFQETPPCTLSIMVCSYVLLPCAKFFFYPQRLLRLAPRLKSLQRIALATARPEPAALVSALALAMPTCLAALAQRHEPNVVLRQRLLALLWQQVVRNVLQMGLLPRRPQLAVVAEVVDLRRIFLKVPGGVQLVRGSDVNEHGSESGHNYLFSFSLLSSSCRSSRVLASRTATLVTARSASFMR